MHHRLCIWSSETTWCISTMVLVTMTSVVVEDLLSFYILFEVMLIVMVMSITSYWYSSRSTYAVYMLVVYTLLGSSAMGIALLLQYVSTGIASSTHGVEVSTSGILGMTTTMLLHVGFYSKVPC